MKTKLFCEISAYPLVLTRSASKRIGDLGDLLAERSKLVIAMAGNRTRVNCLEGSYAHHYTTIAGYIVPCWYLQRQLIFFECHVFRESNMLVL